MKHVLVESNWVFDFCAPAHRRTPDAVSLANRAARGELTLHLPHVALREGEEAIRRKCKPGLKDVRSHARWAVAEGRLTGEQRQAVDAFLVGFEAAFQSDLATLPARVNEVLELPGVDVFALDDEMLAKTLELRSVVDLKPFDEAMLGAVLVKARQVRESSSDEVYFCELDGDLSPNPRPNQVRRALMAEYRDAGLVFRSDFLVP